MENIVKKYKDELAKEFQILFVQKVLLNIANIRSIQC